MVQLQPPAGVGLLPLAAKVDGRHQRTGSYVLRQPFTSPAAPSCSARFEGSGCLIAGTVQEAAKVSIMAQTKCAVS